MNKLVKRLLTGTLAFATILTALPVTAVHASGNQYWTESAERVGYIEHRYCPNRYTNQCHCYKCAGLECGTVWNGRFYRFLRSRSAGKRGSYQ